MTEHREPKGAAPRWTEERGTSDEGRRRPQRRPEASGTTLHREPKGAAPRWTEERGTSDEGRRRPQRRPEASGTTLSLNQEFLCSLDHGETAGALSQWYTITYGLRLRGNLDVGALSAALDDVVARHEMLRTSLRRDDDGWHQHLHPPGPVSFQVQDLGSAG